MMVRHAKLDHIRICLNNIDFSPFSFTQRYRTENRTRLSSFNDIMYPIMIQYAVRMQCFTAGLHVVFNHITIYNTDIYYVMFCHNILYHNIMYSI